MGHLTREASWINPCAQIVYVAHGLHHDHTYSRWASMLAGGTAAGGGGTAAMVIADNRSRRSTSSSIALALSGFAFNNFLVTMTDPMMKTPKNDRALEKAV